MANTEHTISPAGQTYDKEWLIFEPSKATIETVHGDIFELYHLIATIGDELVELDYTLPNGARNTRLDRVSALVEIARRQARTLHNSIARNKRELTREERAVSKDERAAA